MHARYKHLALAEVRPGMVLSDVLLDRQGQVLLPAGTALTAPMLARLPQHGVGMLPIVCEDAREPVDEAAVQARLQHVFRRLDRGNPEHWAAAILRDYVEDYRLEREVAP